MTIFIDREDAGKQLAQKLASSVSEKNLLILALPRGGVPVAYQIAKTLNVPLDLFLVRKLGTPWQEELAMGAIASGDIIVFNEALIAQLNISQREIAEIIAREKKVLEERQKKYLGNHKINNISGKTILLVDDGIATGATIHAAVKALKKLDCEKIIIAVPVAPSETIEALRSEVDAIYCLYTPSPFYAIGSWYQNFSQTSDEEVIECLEKSKKFTAANNNG